MGKVKFYNRRKCFGYIVPDDTVAVGTEIYFCRSDIVSELSSTDSPYEPYLKKGERVQFQVVQHEATQQASNVTWIGGKLIHPFRRSHLFSATRNACKILGHEAYMIMSDESTTEEEKMSKLKDAFDSAKASVTAQEKRIVQMGLKVEDFPTSLSELYGMSQQHKKIDRENSDNSNYDDWVEDGVTEDEKN